MGKLEARCVECGHIRSEHLPGCLTTEEARAMETMLGDGEVDWTHVVDIEAKHEDALPDLLSSLKALVADAKLMRQFRSENSISEYLIRQAEAAIVKAEKEN